MSKGAHAGAGVGVLGKTGAGAGRAAPFEKTPPKGVLTGLAAAEADPDWKKWFREIALRREAAAEKRRGFVLCRIQKDGAEEVIRRRRAEPEKVRSFLRKNTRKAGSSLLSDLGVIRAVWSGVVGQDVAGETEIFSFKNGVVTVSVFSSALLQEIRQFHQTAIISDLRDVWPAATPLLRIVYRLGQR